MSVGPNIPPLSKTGPGARRVLVMVALLPRGIRVVVLAGGGGAVVLGVVGPN